MKAYKIRSLIYLSGFIIAAVAYYHIEQDQNFKDAITTGQTADLESEELQFDEETEDSLD